MISAQRNKPQQERFVAKLVELPNNAVRSFYTFTNRYLLAQTLAGFLDGSDVARNGRLSSIDNIKIFATVLKTNVAAN